MQVAQVSTDIGPDDFQKTWIHALSKNRIDISLVTRGSKTSEYSEHYFKLKSDHQE